MCGICGIWNYKTKEPVPPNLLREMTDSMTHRGPDDSGLHVDDAAGVGLGFRRLSIIDLSPAGHQPMSNEDGTIWLVFNGEIYNFLDLRPQLEVKRHVFRSRTDSEVIIHQYEERGVEWVNDLNGMFGLALWDAPKRRMVLARDRVGKKPLYYYDDGKRLMFASELKAILADSSVPRELDYTALGEYLALGYIAAPRTIFQGIRKLPPGHRMVFEKGSSNIRRYWDWLPAFNSPNHTRSESEWIEEVQELLKTVVRDRLISDVPLGAFLSGGVDSSAVVAIMAELSERPVKTFSIGFHNEQYNELPYARQIAEHFGTEHHEHIVEPESLRDLMPRLVRQFDEPFGDSSAVPTYYVSKMAREQVTVCLSGDGGDEAMAGYSRYAQAIREAKVDGLPSIWRQILFGLPARFMPVGVKGQRLAQRLSAKGAEERYALAICKMPTRHIAELFTPEAVKQLEENKANCIGDAFSRTANLNLISRLQYTDGITYLPEDILVKVDRTSMANSLEVRSPLLDYRFMELMATVPSELHFQNGQGKHLFKKAMRNWLPDQILDRPKMGFGVPLSKWFSDELSDYAAEVLLDHQTLQRGLLQSQAVASILNKHRAGTHSFDTEIWFLLVMELWNNAYINNYG